VPLVVQDLRERDEVHPSHKNNPVMFRRISELLAPIRIAFSMYDTRPDAWRRGLDTQESNQFFVHIIIILLHFAVCHH
jgi:hypothetical protein